MPLTSADVTAERLEKLRELFPEAFTEGKVDFERLRQALGDVVDTGRERYGLSWAGKADAIRAVQTPSVGTLIPVPEESVNFDTTENLIIEGENLEVLKLLQKSYHGKVKMIYIDPPYNTGNEFIYPDDYKEPLKQYLRLTGQVSEEGVKLTTNTETSGRYHSNWLSMMYPRLFLARNLLRDDGVIFVSIDDHEVHNLRLLMDEIFGEENFVAQITWRRKKESSNDNKGFSVKGEYVLCFAKSHESQIAPLPLSESYLEGSYNEPTKEFPEGRWRPVPIAVTKGHQGSGYEYEIKTPSGKRIKRLWLYPEESYRELVKAGRIYFGKKGDSIPQRVIYEHESKGVPPDNVWYNLATNKNGKKELVDLLGVAAYSTPKPTMLIRRMIEIACSSEGIILDFFAGSGTTAHAVLDLNKEDGGNRKFVLVQLPEPLDPNNKDQKAGADFCDSIGKPRNIVEITKERVRRVIQKLNNEDAEKLDLNGDKKQDRGFRVFKLATSNFKIWEGEKVPQDAEGLAEQLKLYADHVLEGRSQQDILYELILKSGLPLTAKIEEKFVTGKTVYSIADGLLLICLEDEVTAELLRGMIDLKPQQIICLDRAFRGNDQLKTNTVLEMKQRKITFRTV